VKTVVAAALGECVHVAGVVNFLRLAKAAGWRTVFLGPAVPIKEVLAAARREKADMVGVSYLSWSKSPSIRPGGWFVQLIDSSSRKIKSHRSFWVGESATGFARASLS
jgi:hypothetical protein